MDILGKTAFWKINLAVMAGVGLSFLFNFFLPYSPIFFYVRGLIRI